MRVFASDTVKSLMGRMGLAEDEPIQNGMITRSLESAQTKIEGFNFDARKRILEFDDVLNVQRAAVYNRRRKILTGSVEEIFAEVAEVVSGVVPSDDINFVDDGSNNTPPPDFKKIIQDKRTALGDERFGSVLRQAFLQIIDTFWVEHLEVMDYMRSSVNLRAYGQRDPLVEYRKEGLRLFKEMQVAVDEELIKAIPNLGGNIAAETPKNLTEVHENAALVGGVSNPSGDAGGARGGQNSVAKKTGADGVPEVGRNELCPCGSGKKYKKCHGK